MIGEITPTQGNRSIDIAHRLYFKKIRSGYVKMMVSTNVIGECQSITEKSLAVIASRVNP